MPRVLYLLRSENRAGSAYKYLEMFQRVLPGQIVAGEETALNHALRQGCDVAVVRGDMSTHFDLCRRQKTPYLLIEQDVATMRGARCPAERSMIEGALGVLFNSRGTRDYCVDRYRIRHHEVVPLRPLAEQLDFEPRTKLEGRTMVYAGGLVSWRHRRQPWGYRAYHDIFARIMAHGWEMHVYPGRDTRQTIIDEYTELGCTVHDSVPEAVLPRELSRYSAGLQAYNLTDVPGPTARYVAACAPNKTYLYLAAGIPTVGFSPGGAGEVYDGRWGVVVENLQDLETIELSPVRAADRRAEVMDHDLPAFERLAAIVGDTERTVVSRAQ